MINQGNSRKRRETTKDREAEYCDDRVCPSVCLCVCLSARRELISETTRPIFARFVGILPVAVARSSSHPLPALRFVMYFRFMDDDDVMFAPQCPGVYSDTKRRALKVGLINFPCGWQNPERSRYDRIVSRPTSLLYTTVLIYKYQLSPVDPRDKIVLLTALDDLCDTL